jgi:hypothetical protein
MAERRDLGQELRLDVVARHEELDRIDARGQPCIDEILTLDCEQPELVPPAAVVQLADELELLVLA